MKRLSVFALVSTDRGIPDVPHSEVSPQARHVVLIEDLKDEPEPFLDVE